MYYIIAEMITQRKKYEKVAVDSSSQKRIGYIWGWKSIAKLIKV